MYAPSQYEEPHTWLYEADEDDYDFDEADMTWRGGVAGIDFEAGAGEEEEPLQVIIEANVPSDAFHDDLGLLKCWGAALLEYKFLHPESFGPSRDAPLTLAKKLEAAPLWYAPAPSAATSNIDSIPAKKRKSVNQRKNDAKKRKTAASEPIPANNDAPDSPSYTPQSPNFGTYSPPPHLQLSLNLLPSESLPLPGFTGPQLPTAPPPIGPVLERPSTLLPTPTTFQPPPIPTSTASLAARAYPMPPPMLEPSEDILESTAGKTAEELLQSALWSWYEAGYNTAIYHQALKVVEQGEKAFANAVEK